MPTSATAYKQAKERAGHSHAHSPSRSLSHANPSQRSPTTAYTHASLSPRRHLLQASPLHHYLPRGLALGTATSARNACALLCLLACLGFSAISLGRHLFDDPSATLPLAEGGDTPSSLSGGLFSDPSDQLVINFEEHVGLVQLRFWDNPQGRNESTAPSPTASSDASSGASSDASSNGTSSSRPGAPQAAGNSEAHPKSATGTPGDKAVAKGSKQKGGAGSGSGSGRGRAGGVPGAGAPPSTAICLSGSAQFFDASGPSILKHLVARYAPADVLVNAPLDAGTAKLWLLLLRLPHLAALRVFPPTDLDEKALSQGVLKNPSTPGGLQALLQQMRLVEGCLELIHQREKRNRMVYPWIVHARLDSYWAGPPPALGSLDKKRYTVPRGKGLAAYSGISGFSDSGGGGACNGLFGVGARATSAAAMRRISALRGLKKARKYKDLSPQGAYSAQLELAHVAVSRAPLPFCTLVRLTTREAAPGCTPALPSLASPGPLDGAPCMPCMPCPSSAHDSKAAAAELLRNLGLKRPEDLPGAKACSLRDAWKEGQWERRFDAVAGRDLASDRRLVTAILQSKQTCNERWKTLRAKSQAWAAPGPGALCLRFGLGEATLLGKGSGAYPTFLRPLSNTSLAIATATSAPPKGPQKTDKSWEEALRKAVGAQVLTWHLAELNSTAASLTALKAPRIDVLKLGPAEGEFRVLDLLLLQYKEIPVCQLLVTFPKPSPQLLASIKVRGPKPPPSHGAQKLLYLYAEPLSKARLQLSSCSGGHPQDVPERCHFFSLKFCQP